MLIFIHFRHTKQFNVFFIWKEVGVRPKVMPADAHHEFPMKSYVAMLHDVSTIYNLRYTLHVNIVFRRTILMWTSVLLFPDASYEVTHNNPFLLAAISPGERYESSTRHFAKNFEKEAWFKRATSLESCSNINDVFMYSFLHYDTFM